MLCEKCQQQQATVHMQQYINGEKSQMNLCQDCAIKIDTGLSFDNIFQGFLDSIMSMHGLNINEGYKKETAVECPGCGLKYEGFKNTGRLGCGECYRTFGKELESIFKNVQSSNRHNGKFPHKAGAEHLLKRELDNLRLSLSKAVENEEYEEAARLRDKIRGLEAGVKEL